MLNTLKRNGYWDAFKVLAGLAVTAAVLVPAILYTLAGA